MTLLVMVLVFGALLMLMGRFMTAAEPEAAVPLPAVYAPPPHSEAPGGTCAIEERLESFLSLVEGAGPVRVMVGFSSERETVFAVDSSASESVTREEDAQGGNREVRQQSNNTQTVLVPDRNGASMPLVLRETQPHISGIVIIAEGGADARVRAELTRAAQAILGLDAHKIQVLQMQQN